MLERQQGIIDYLAVHPFLLLAVMPCFSVIDPGYSYVLGVLPNVSGIMLMLGAFWGIASGEAVLRIAVLFLWILLMLFMALRVYDKRILYGRAGK